MSTNHEMQVNDTNTLVERLRRSERDAAKKLAHRRASLDAAGHWHWSDPLHQRLSSVLRRIREELRQAEADLRRTSRASAQAR